MRALARQKLFGHESSFYARNAQLFAGTGLEVGGPSGLFAVEGYAPVYAHAGRLDNVNFAHQTRWEGVIHAGDSFTFRAGCAPGTQYLREATDLQAIGDGTYDFLISSHMLEHCANPMKALREWQRVMRPDGTLILVLPHKDGTFDWRRPVTPLRHMIEDDERDVGEDDRTHFDEVLRLHDLKRDIFQPSAEAFRTWVEGNTVNRGLHHHVFDSHSAARLVDHAGFEILCVEPAETESIFVFARKPQRGHVPRNEDFTSLRAPFLKASPFPSDRRRARSGGNEESPAR
ncbi:MAG: methyltransferase domain-containing protein [Ramlibacter sp.]|nr:methyltransferase domain-containing protein [Ramlibacter sp.]